MGSGVRMLRRLLIAAVLAAFVVACLRLGWWQLQRYQSPGGSFQNLGYTLQWPTFAIFALFMVWRLSRLERQREHQRQSGGEPQPRPEPPPAATTADPRDDEPDDELAAYNRYLAQLNAKERDRAS